MLIRPVLWLAILVLLSEVLLAEKLYKADRIPATVTAEQKELILEGITFHKKGQYDEAIAKYQQVLQQSPDLVEAMHEMAYSYFAKKDLETALSIALRGSQYRSELLPLFHIMIGNSLDDLGRRGESIGVYKAAIKQAPQVALLHFNLGLSLLRDNNVKDGRKALQQAVRLNPNHASSHLLLASVYKELGYRIPAILAFSRFALIEPTSTRTAGVIALLNQLIGGGVTKGEKPDEINIILALTPGSKKDEGDFDGVEVAMSMSVAAAQMKSVEAKLSAFQQLATIYGTMSAMMADIKKKGFAAAYYAPFFADIDKRELMEAFVYSAFQSAQLDGAETWAKENEMKIREFQGWLAEYKWPALK